MARNEETPFKAGEALAWLYANVTVLSVETGEDGNRVAAKAPISTFNRFERRFGIKFSASDADRSKAAE